MRILWRSLVAVVCSAVALATLVAGPSRADAFTAYAVGDIGECGGKPGATAALIPQGGMLFALGDLAYPQGRAQDFRSCYLPAYGRLKSTTFPVIGNHEYYGNPSNPYYFSLFGPRVGKVGASWYTVRRGSWLFVMLDSNCDLAGGCAKGSPQYAWLSRTLANYHGRCLAAAWHHPRWSSAAHGDNPEVGPMVRLLRSRGADLILNGHDHAYLRYPRLAPNGDQAADGVREFVVGTGGADLYPLHRATPRPAVAANGAHGVLKLRFRATDYSWRFLSTDGKRVDTGTDSCR
ncbi:MAG: metallophosphoesterase [Candidatus Nanopelagicales bacterium]